MSKFELLDELEYILNYENSSGSAVEIIEELKRTDPTRRQESLIYDLVGLAYELGKREG